jgi:hypothetical protein
VTALTVLGLVILFGTGVFIGWRLSSENQRIERTFRELIADLDRPTEDDPVGPSWGRPR